VLNKDENEIYIKNGDYQKGYVLIDYNAYKLQVNSDKEIQACQAFHYVSSLGYKDFLTSCMRSRLR